MSTEVNRRHFLLGTTAAGVTAALAGPTGAQDAGANNRLVVGIMGTGGRGTGLAGVFQRQPNVEVAYVCDPDRAHVDGAADVVRKAGNPNVRAVADFHRILD